MGLGRIAGKPCRREVPLAPAGTATRCARLHKFGLTENAASPLRFRSLTYRPPAGGRIAGKPCRREVPLAPAGTRTPASLLLRNRLRRSFRFAQKTLRVLVSVGSRPSNMRKTSRPRMAVCLFLVLQRGLEPRTPCLKAILPVEIFGLIPRVFPLLCFQYPFLLPRTHLKSPRPYPPACSPSDGYRFSA